MLPSSGAGHAGRYVEVDGRRLYLEQHGEAGPVVVIEVGLGYKPRTEHQGWFPIRDSLTERARVCMYDRAGYGRSDAFPTAPTITDYAADLRALLHAAHLPPPYVLVGSSIGGLIVLTFGHLYPDEVKGVVMVDGAHPEQWERMAALLPPGHLAEDKAVRAFYEDDIAAVMNPSRNDEGMDLPASIPELRGATLGDLPLVVLTAGKSEWDEEFPQAVAADIDREWLVMQRELAALSTRGVQQVIGDSGHCMHDERPDEVIAAVDKLLADPTVV